MGTCLYDASDEQLEAVARLSLRSDLNLKEASYSWSYFSLVIALEETNPERLVENTAQRIALVLREMTDAFEKAAPKKGKK